MWKSCGVQTQAFYSRVSALNHYAMCNVIPLCCFVCLCFQSIPEQHKGWVPEKSQGGQLENGCSHPSELGLGYWGWSKTGQILEDSWERATWEVPIGLADRER